MNCNLAQREKPLQSVCAFLAEYAAALIAAGSTCRRVERNVERMAQAFGVTAIITILPAHVSVDIEQGNNTEHATKQVPHTPVNFNVNSLLSSLSWQVADRKVKPEEASEKFHAITRTPFIPGSLLLSLVTLANIGFCRIFGGDLPSTAIVGVATVIGFYLKALFVQTRIDARITLMLCAFVSSVIGSSGYVFGLCNTPEIALGTSVLYLIPGVCYLNSVSDLMDGHHLCAWSRFANGLMMTGCISIGLTFGVLVMNLSILE